MTNKQAKSKSPFWSKFERDSPRLFTTGILALAVILTQIDYTFGEWAFHPRIHFWLEKAYWSDMLEHAALPLLFWFGWIIVSLGQLKTARFLLGLFAIVFAGNAILYSIPNVVNSLLKIQNHQLKSPVERWHWAIYWDWQMLWTPAALLIGNIVILRSWYKLIATHFFGSKSNETDAQSTRRSAGLKNLAVATACAAILLTAVHLILPRMPINQTTVSLSEIILVPSRLKNDFDYLATDQAYQRKQVGTILTHVELADLQRKQFYRTLDDSVFQEFILSPKVDALPLNELDWRRTLWESVYPKIRYESNPVVATRIIVRFLRERIGIDPQYHFRIGVETIWIEQMTDQSGFNRIYVAALRSVGVAARLGDQGPEFWTGSNWERAPEPLLHSITSIE